MSDIPANDGPFDAYDATFPFIDDDFDWDAFFNFEPEIDNPSVSRQDGSLTQWEPLDSAPQGQSSSFAPADVPGNPHTLPTETNPPPMAESSASSQVTREGNVIKLNQDKRGIQDYLSSFLVHENSVPPPSKRRAFSPDRRTEVAKVRKIKACQRCKMRKLSCQANGVCRNCIMSVAEDVALGEQICHRCTLVEIRFGAGDLLRESYSKESINKLPSRTNSVLQTVFVWFHSEYKDNALRLEVEDYSENRDDKDHVMAFTTGENDPSQPQFSSLPTPKYVIINHSLPSVRQLGEWIQQQVGRRKPGWSPAATLFNSFHTLLDILCNTTSEVLSKDFSKAALQITNLYECWRNVLLAAISQLQTPTSYLSRAAGIQIALIAKQGITDCEIQILSKLDNLIQQSKRPSKESELNIWAGVWILFLMYRDILRRYRHMSRCQPKYETSIFLARRMYNALGSTYNLLFRNKSPLQPNWREDESFAQIGRSTEIRGLLILIKEQTQFMYDQSFDLGEDEHILQCLIAEQKRTVPSLSQSPTFGTVRETSAQYVAELPFNTTRSGGGGGGRGLGWDPCYGVQPCDTCYGS